MELFQRVTDWWWLVPLAGVGLVAYRFLGWRGLLAVATLGLLGGLYTKGRTDERQAAEQAEAEARSRAIEARRGIEDEIDKLDPSAVRDRLGKWVRNDDEG